MTGAVTAITGSSVYTPDSLAYDASTQSLYAVSVIDARTNKVVKTVTAGAVLNGIGIDTSSHTVFAANGADENVTVIDGTTNTVTSTIQVGTPQYEAKVAVRDKHR